jgi:hypothetical protein
MRRALASSAVAPFSEPLSNWPKKPSTFADVSHTSRSKNLDFGAARRRRRHQPSDLAAVEILPVVGDGLAEDGLEIAKTVEAETLRQSGQRRRIDAELIGEFRDGSDGRLFGRLDQLGKAPVLCSRSFVF